MPPFAVDLNELLAATNIVDQVFLGLQFAPQLVRVGDFKFGAAFYNPAIGLQFTQQDFNQGGFTCAVGADNANAVTALNNSGKIVDDCAIAEGLAYVL